MEIPDRAYPTTGFAEGRSVYFDAIEALDFTVGIGGR